MGIQAFTERIKNLFKIRKTLSEDLFEELTDLLVEGDFGAAGAYQTVENLREICRKEKAGTAEEARLILARLLENTLLKTRAKLEEKLPGAALPEGMVGIILLLGVNGVGKTTTAAKLAARYRALKRRPILAAADTFRAAAIDQLKIHGEKLGIRVVAHKHGGDPAAVIFDALETASAGNGDLIIADTAGRMHNKAALVEELKKIDRVVKSKAADSLYLKWLVLDATTGRNALVQAETFNAAIALDAAILTKYDSSARGGVVFSLAEELGLPVVFVCDGEQYDNIHPFEPHAYAMEFIGPE